MIVSHQEKLQSNQTQARLRLAKVMPTIDYLLAMESHALRKRFNANEALSPHIILGIPINVSDAVVGGCRSGGFIHASFS